MFTPQFLLIALAILIAVVYLPALANPKKFRKALRNWACEKEAVRTSGFLMFLLAMMFLSVHWKLTGKWMMVISILGWLTLLKGTVFIWNPDWIKRIIKKWKIYNSDNGIAIVSIVAIAIAAILVYLALKVVTIGEIVAG